MDRCEHVNEGGDGVVRFCDQPRGHRGWHGMTVELHQGSSTTNWGDDGLAIHASRGRLIDGRWQHPARRDRRNDVNSDFWR